MSDYPKNIAILEEAARDGLQSISRIIPTSDKVTLVERLASTGLKEINCTSFVNRDLVPQMADAEDLAARLTFTPGVNHYCLWLNERGFERARGTHFDLRPVIVGSASATFLLKNSNRTPDASLSDQRRMMNVYRQAGLHNGPIYIFTAFGCNYEGDVAPRKVVDLVETLVNVFREAGETPAYVCLCDTVGAGNPALIERVTGAVRERWPDIDVALHLHDTRGMGIANAFAGLRMGVARFDASVGGLGGCPFAGNRAASGNITTEELVFLAEELGIDTGIDLESLIDAAKLAETIVGQPLPSRIMKAGSLQGFRRASA